MPTNAKGVGNYDIVDKSYHVFFYIIEGGTYKFTAYDLRLIKGTVQDSFQ
jgi:hypothetical protein